MRSISRLYCSAIKEERLKSPFIAIMSIPSLPEFITQIQMPKVVNGTNRKPCVVFMFSLTLGIIPAIYRRRNGFHYYFIAA